VFVVVTAVLKKIIKLKIIGTNLISEAFLYEEQTRRAYYVCYAITTTTASDKVDQCVGVKVKYDF
jgi:hypothetical protein